MQILAAGLDDGHVLLQERQRVQLAGCLREAAFVGLGLADCMCGVLLCFGPHLLLLLQPSNIKSGLHGSVGHRDIPKDGALLDVMKVKKSLSEDCQEVTNAWMGERMNAHWALSSTT